MGESFRCRHEVGDDPARLAEVDAVVRAVDPDAQTVLDPDSGRISVLTVMVPALFERLMHDLEEAHEAAGQPCANNCEGCVCGGTAPDSLPPSLGRA